MTSERRDNRHMRKSAGKETGDEECGTRQGMQETRAREYRARGKRQEARGEHKLK